MSGPAPIRPGRALEHTAIVVGAGVTGIAMSHHLARHGIDHIVLEREEGVGGIWRSERWPGVRCDTEFVSYSFSFAPVIADRPLISGRAIARYLARTAEETGVESRISFRTSVKRATFDEIARRWTVETNRGRHTARFLINANGYFSDDPHIPCFAGIGDYRGEIVHLSAMTERAELGGRRVILVGSGASAITAAPAFARHARSVTIVQRSPSYIYEDRNRLGRPTRLARRFQREGLHWPVAAVRFGNRVKNDFFFVAFRAWPNLGRWVFRRHWRKQLRDTRLLENMTPSYGPWRQRIPVSVGLKDCVASGSVRFVTGTIRRFTAAGVLLEDGRSVAGDLCVLATGRDLDLFKFELFRGDTRIDPARLNYFKGMMLGGVPNYFQPFGVVHATWTQRVERVCRLIVGIMGHMERHGYERVAVAREDIRRRPKITPNYIVRNLHALPAIHGTFEIPTLDTWVRFSFRAGDYVFSPPARRSGASAANGGGDVSLTE